MATSIKQIFICRYFSSFVNAFVTMSYFTLIASVLFSTTFVQSVDRPRGVPLSKMSFYNPAHPFTCLDGSQTLNYERINDDYCDCVDGSDEPGTAACPNGFFTCSNKGHVPKSIPASRVNDGICDCCDGQDEYGKHQFCEDTCHALGMAVREELEKRRQVLIEGHRVFLEYAAEGQKAKNVNQERLETLVKEKDALENERMDLEDKKKLAEEPERVAKDARDKTWQEEKQKREADAEEANAQAAFVDLDHDGDGRLSFTELKMRPEYDADGDGEVQDEEAKNHLDGSESVSLDEFKDKTWSGVKLVYKAPEISRDPDISRDQQSVSPELPKEETETPTDESPDDTQPEVDHETEVDEEDDFDGAEDRLPDHAAAIVSEVSSSDQMPEYNEETKKLIEAADSARAAFNEVDTKYRDLDKQIRELEELNGLDFGPDQAFYSLKGRCFEYTDREYTYKLCPFQQASQRSKHGGTETVLGRWGSWHGDTDTDRYSKMKYDHGLNCWNGPDRSMTVILHCGGQNELTSVSEPSRCEYQAELYTPALCSSLPPPAATDINHDEL